MQKRSTKRWIVLILTAAFALAACALVTQAQTDLTRNLAKSETPIAVFASHPAPVLGVLIDEDGKVVYVEPGSAAEEAGITRGDLLETIAGIAVDKREDVRVIVRGASSDQFLKVKIKRNGSEIELSIRSRPPTPRTGKATPTPVSSLFDYL